MFTETAGVSQSSATESFALGTTSTLASAEISKGPTAFDLTAFFPLRVQCSCAFALSEMVDRLSDQMAQQLHKSTGINFEQLRQIYSQHNAAAPASGSTTRESGNR
eukprot:18066-Heterococcus_DN1.PRE.1